MTLSCDSRTLALALAAGLLACLSRVSLDPLGFRCEEDSDCRGSGFCVAGVCASEPAGPADSGEVQDAGPAPDSGSDAGPLGDAGATVLLAAGNIADSSGSGAALTAALLDSIDASVVLTLGDHAKDGFPTDFANYFDPSWGRHKTRIRPSPGDYDYHLADAGGYFQYFGAAAGDAGQGYYSFDLGGWHLVALNSECSEVGGCEFNSDQERWLRADLANHPAACTLAFWHKPRYSSGPHGSHSEYGAFFTDLYNAGVEVVLSAHDYNYERFLPQAPGGVADSARGVIQFVVGTGGKPLRAMDAGFLKANSAVRNDDALGVLKLTLHPGSYDWEFVPAAGSAYTDQGTANCH